MKELNTSAFDPKAKDRELKSPVDDFPAIERPKQLQPTNRVSEPDPPGRPDPGVQLSSTTRRKIKSRHCFDVYEDQVEELQKLAMEDRMRGGPGSQSAMVREALDDYIAKRRAGH